MTSWPPPLSCFVTGTDTGVGKTLISAALLHWLARQGWRSAGFKPVAAGTELIEGRYTNEDVQTLRVASSVPLSDAEVGPCQFKAACAPHIAAALENRIIDRSAILQAAHGLARRSDALVIEGVGGFRVPLGEDWDTADLAQDLELPVILVVGLRLGCINHALLTADAVRARGLRLMGWVGNMIDPDMPWCDENITSLTRRLSHQYAAPRLGLVPWLPCANAAQASAYLDETALRSLFPVP